MVEAAMSCGRLHLTSGNRPDCNTIFWILWHFTTILADLYRITLHVIAPFLLLSGAKHAIVPVRLSPCAANKAHSFLVAVAPHTDYGVHTQVLQDNGVVLWVCDIHQYVSVQWADTQPDVVLKSIDERNSIGNESFRMLSMKRGKYY